MTNTRCFDSLSHDAGGHHAAAAAAAVATFSSSSAPAASDALFYASDFFYSSTRLTQVTPHFISIHLVSSQTKSTPLGPRHLAHGHLCASAAVRRHAERVRRLLHGRHLPLRQTTEPKVALRRPGTPDASSQQQGVAFPLDRLDLRQHLPPVSRTPRRRQQFGQVRRFYPSKLLYVVALFLSGALIFFAVAFESPSAAVGALAGCAASFFVVVTMTEPGTLSRRNKRMLSNGWFTVSSVMVSHHLIRHSCRAWDDMDWHALALPVVLLSVLR